MKINRIVSICLSTLAIVQITSVAAFAQEVDCKREDKFNEMNLIQFTKFNLTDKRRFIAWNGIIFDLSIKESQEMSHHDKKSGKTIYNKTVTEEEVYYKEKNSSLLLSQIMHVKFTYDNEKVWIENPEKDITYATKPVNKNWKLVEYIDNLNNRQDQCLISASWKIFNRENETRDWNYKETAFCDIMCSKDGKLTYKYK